VGVLVGVLVLRAFRKRRARAKEAPPAPGTPERE
jgi:hypothetical protein